MVQLEQAQLVREFGRHQSYSRTVPSDPSFRLDVGYALAEPVPNVIQPRLAALIFNAVSAVIECEAGNRERAR
jgi:hypothetical protein